MTVSPARCCSPSLRAIVTVSGEKAAACLDWVPAENDGEKPPAQPEGIAKPDEGVASGPDSGADHGDRSLVVV